MKASDRYIKLVEWSDEDGCYIGRCPELMLGGVHGKVEKQVFAELCEVIDEWVERATADHEELPAGMAGRKYSGKFNLRLGARLHERLAIAALKEGKSLNNYVAEVLGKRLER